MSTPRTRELILLAELLDESFIRILEIMAQVGIGVPSPKFFIIYAHDNDKFPDHKANAAIVRKYIDWFKKLGLDVDSDRSPHGWAAGRGAEISGASNDILKNQLCLLPPEWDSRNVDWVIVFDSQLLAKYVEDERNWRLDDGRTYTEALVKECWKLNKTHNSRDPEWENTVYEATESVQKDFSSMKTTFHYILTELALVQFRIQYHTSPRTILASLTEGSDFESCFPGSVSSRETLLREPVNHQDLYKSFFKIILRFETIERDRFLIEQMRDCFLECKKLLEKNKGALGQTQYRITCEGIVLKTLQSLVQSPRYQKLERKITLPEIRKILNLHSLMDLSSIQRVSGDVLPVECRNIDLVVADHNTEASDPRHSQLVKLENLFDEIQLRAKQKITPKRILIRGLPGIGKSTLSRRIAFEYSCHRSLLNKHDLVVRLPLRRLEHTRDIQQLFFEEFFSLERSGRELAGKLAGAIRDQAGKYKILFILDGLDETVGWAGENHTLLAELINQTFVIITSRFGVAGTVPMNRIDLELEAIGLSLESIWAYLDNRAITVAEDVAAIRQYIKENQTVKEMVQVPIHLDILCYSWDELKRRKGIASSGSWAAEAPTTTEIYQAIIHKLWRKDIPRFKKWDHGEPLTENIIEAVRSPKRLERAVQAEINLLGKLAIMLLEKGRVEFVDTDIDTVIEELEAHSGALPLSLESHLPVLSFVRRESNRNSQRTYKFIHLTFQEYFAATYLAQNPSVLKRQLRKHKYSRRFEVVWRFVAGLLPSEHVEIEHFFFFLEEEPRDLVGIRHVYLLMRCLSECQGSMDKSLKQRLQTGLWDWVEYEIDRETGSDTILNDAAFPREIFEHKIKTMLDEAKTAQLPVKLKLPDFSLHFRNSDWFCNRILEYVEEGRLHPKQAYNILNTRSLSPSYIQRLLGYLQNDEPNAVTEFVELTLENHTFYTKEYPGFAIDELVRILLDPLENNQPWTWRQEVSKANLEDLLLPSPIIQRLVRGLKLRAEHLYPLGLLSHAGASDDVIYEGLWAVLWAQSPLSPLPLEAVHVLLDIFSRIKADNIMRIIAHGTDLDTVTIQRLRDEIRSSQQTRAPDILIRLALYPRLQDDALASLKKHWDYPGMGLATLSTHLEEFPRALPSSFQLFVIEMLETEDPGTRRFAADILNKQPTLEGPDVRSALEKASRSYPWDVARALRSHGLAIISKEPISWLVTQLSKLNKDKPDEPSAFNEACRIAASHFSSLFWQESPLSQTVINCIMEVLTGFRPRPGKRISDTFLGPVLSQVKTLERTVLSTLLSMLEKWGSDDASSALQGRPEVLEEVMNIFEGAVDRDIVRAAGMALTNLDPVNFKFKTGVQCLLPASIIQRLHSLLQSKDALKPDLAAQVLVNQSKLGRSVIRDLLYYFEIWSPGWLEIRHPRSPRDVQELCRYAEYFNSSTLQRYLSLILLKKPHNEALPAWIHGDSLYYYTTSGSTECYQLKDEEGFRKAYWEAQEAAGVPTWIRIHTFTHRDDARGQPVRQSRNYR
jgi:hypothetical protein